MNLEDALTAVMGWLFLFAALVGTALLAALTGGC